MNYFDLPLEQWTNKFVDHWLLPKMSGFFDHISDFLRAIVEGVTDGLLFIPAELLVLLFIILSWRIAGRGVAVFALLGFLFIGSVDLWEESMQTFAIVIVSTILSMMVGIPLGILSAKNKVIDQIVRPILDFMQTLPSFVYLIPSILLFGLGSVPAVIATFIFAAPPAVRMTTLGIKQVPKEVIEASQAFGATSRQLLFKVQLPLGLPTIMAGVNQSIMLALSMAVVASMIGSPGLGSTVLSGISNVNIGLGLTGGLAIVVLAIVLDRITQQLGKSKRRR